MFNPARKLRYGFTLIELLIVIAIIGILAAAVLIAVNPAKRQNQAKDAQIKSDIGSVATALQAYYTQPGEGSYPLTLSTLVDNGDLKQMPTPPSGSNASGNYEYLAFNTNGTACTGVGTADPCEEARIYALVLDQPTGQIDDVWCYESVTGKAQLITVAANCDHSAATL